MVSMNGSAGYADVDTGIAIVVGAQPILPGLPMARLDDIVAEPYPPPANPEERSP
jgi:hypothetical protein